MGSTPGFKVYDADGVYQAATADATLAAAVLAALPDGSRVKFNGRIVWRGDTVEGLDAAESYDAAADRMYETIERHRAERALRWAS
jgi:hypothetical protein